MLRALPQATALAPLMCDDVQPEHIVGYYCLLSHTKADAPPSSVSSLPLVRFCQVLGSSVQRVATVGVAVDALLSNQHVFDRQKLRFGQPAASQHKQSTSTAWQQTGPGNAVKKVDTYIHTH
jgi:hypothetical protein